MSSKEKYNQRALEYAERYGIINYRVEGNNMIFNISYPAYLSNPRYTIQHKVNLDTGVDTVRSLKRFDPKGLQNRG